MRTKRGKDVSNAAVMLMLVVVIVVNMISFGLYFSALNDAAPVVSSNGQGKLFLNVFKPNSGVRSAPDTEKATLALTVVKPTS